MQAFHSALIGEPACGYRKLRPGLADMRRWATLIAGMIDLLKLLGALLVGVFRSHAAREAEMAFLRQQPGAGDGPAARRWSHSQYSGAACDRLCRAAALSPRLASLFF
jgi:hypothetical protein